MTNSSDFKKEIINKLLTGELEIIQYESNNPVETIPNMGRYDFHYPGTKTVTITFEVKKTDKDLIKELEEENRKLRGKLDKLNQILNPSQEGFPDEYYEGQ